MKVFAFSLVVLIAIAAVAAVTTRETLSLDMVVKNPSADVQQFCETVQLDSVSVIGGISSKLMLDYYGENTYSPDMYFKATGSEGDRTLSKKGIAFVNTTITNYGRFEEYEGFLRYSSYDSVVYYLESYTVCAGPGPSNTTFQGTFIYDQYVEASPSVSVSGDTSASSDASVAHHFVSLNVVAAVIMLLIAFY